MRKREGNRKKKKWGRKVMKTKVLRQLGPGFTLETEEKVCVFWGGRAEPSRSLSQTQETDEQGKGGLRGVHSLHSMCKDIKGLPWRGSAQAAVRSAIPAPSTAVHPGVHLYYSLHMEGTW